METSKKDILYKYMNYVLDHEHIPTSVHSFSKELEIDEKEFYQFYSSLEQIASDVYNVFYEETLKLISSDASYDELDSKNKLLVFYFTFFELITNNRSYVMMSLGKGSFDLRKIKQLHLLRNQFKDFTKSLNINTVDLKQEKLNTIKEKGIEELAWAQLLFTIKFWMEDTSIGFEKTDLFIEKSVNASFDLINITPLENIIDLGKFFFKEKIKPQF